MSNTSRNLCGTFERSAAFYDVIHADKDYDSEAAVVAHNLRLADDMRVIEFGAGTGGFTRRIADRGFRVVATDPSRQMTEIAIAKASGNPRISHLQCGVENWHGAFDRESIDVPFHAGLCMFGAMSYAASARYNSLVSCLKSVRGLLYYNAKFLFDVVNAGFCSRDTSAFSSRKAFEFNGQVVERMVRKRFDYNSGVQVIDIHFATPDDQWDEIHVMRAFTPAEVCLAADQAKFKVETQFSGGADRETVRVEASDYMFTTLLVAK